MKIGFIGAGKMAEGILSAMPSKKNVIMAEKLDARREEMGRKHGVRTTADANEAVKKSDIVFLAVRPQDVDSVAAATRDSLTAEKTLVSIVAGKTLAKLRKAFGRKCGLVRVMPNLALRAKAGMCAICPAKGADSKAVDAVAAILSGAGKTVILKERDFDAVTALSGSGPAYFAYMQQAMERAGAKLGLKKDVAKLLAAQTMYGTAKFLNESGIDLAEFIAGVATKGGTTAAGMEELAKGGAFEDIVARTLAAAAARSKALA